MTPNPRKAYFGRRYGLSASHRLNVESFTPEQNRRAYGKCNNPHGHGHNYVVEVLVGGNVDAATGMVINVVDLDSTLREVILERFDWTIKPVGELLSSESPVLIQRAHNVLLPT